MSWIHIHIQTCQFSSDSPSDKPTIVTVELKRADRKVTLSRITLRTAVGNVLEGHMSYKTRYVRVLAIMGRSGGIEDALEVEAVKPIIGIARRVNNSASDVRRI